MFENTGRYTTAMMSESKDRGNYLSSEGNKKNLMIFLAHSGSNITKEERSTTRRLAREGLREMSLLKRPSLMERLQPVQKDVTAIAYSIFGFETHHNFHLGIPNILMEHTFTYLESNVVRSQPGKSVHERKPLSTMQTTTQ